MCFPRLIKSTVSEISLLILFFSLQNKVNSYLSQRHLWFTFSSLTQWKAKKQTPPLLVRSPPYRVSLLEKTAELIACVLEYYPHILTHTQQQPFMCLKQTFKENAPSPPEFPPSYKLIFTLWSNRTIQHIIY